MNSAQKLHVLLTNDDGHAAPGIQAMRSVLRLHGHRVSMVAPSEEQSATSMSTTTRRSLPLADLGGGDWHLDAQPADTVFVALRHLLEDDPPDLVVSGVNFGPNLGTGLHASGTVGAAVVALLHGYPAIAVSAGMLFEEARHANPTFPSTLSALEPAAEFTCTVIEALIGTREKQGGLLPQGVLLNINYPALPRDKIRGVLYPEISTGHMIELAYDRCQDTGHMIPKYLAGVNPLKPQREKGDVRAHLEGYITVSPVKPNWNPEPAESSALLKRLNNGKLDF